jgi:hypothetical protein
MKKGDKVHLPVSRKRAEHVEQSLYGSVPWGIANQRWGRLFFFRGPNATAAWMPILTIET